MKTGNSNHPSCLEYTRDFLSRLSYLQEIPENAILVSFNVVGIYPNMLHEERIDISMWTVYGRHYMAITFTRFTLLIKSKFIQSKSLWIDARENDISPF